MNFCRQMREATDSTWRRIFDHPFVTEAREGDLSEQRFRYYLRQDYGYLWDFQRVLAAAASKSPHREALEHLSRQLRAVRQGEMARHEMFAEQLGLSREELRGTEPSPTALAYRNHLLRSAHDGSVGEIIASLLPCPWTYEVLHRRLMEEGLPDHPVYRPWIRSYVEPEALDLPGMSLEEKQWLRDFLNECAEEAAPGTRERMAFQFKTSVKYEWMFWEMAYRQQEWPV